MGAGQDRADCPLLLHDEIKSGRWSTAIRGDHYRSAKTSSSFDSTPSGPAQRPRGSLFEDQQPATNISIPADHSSARMPTYIDTNAIWRQVIGVSWFGGPLELDVDLLRERSLRYIFPDISTQAHLEHTVRLVARLNLRRADFPVEADSGLIGVIHCDDTPILSNGKHGYSNR